jgi:membrane-associated phospholipid phosphatase
MRYIKIDSIWDALSLTVLLPNYLVIYEIIAGNIELFAGILITLTLEKFGKKITGSWEPSIFKRPDNARDCSLFNDGGFVGNNPGFPSGHVAMASFFSYIAVFKYYEINYKNMLIASLYPLLMSITRYYKGCHNIYQVLAGWILGLLVANIIRYIARYDKVKLKEESKEKVN